MTIDDLFRFLKNDDSLPAANFVYNLLSFYQCHQPGVARISFDYHSVSNCLKMSNTLIPENTPFDDYKTRDLGPTIRICQLSIEEISVNEHLSKLVGTNKVLVHKNNKNKVLVL